jgi:hypothetical protein
MSATNVPLSKRMFRTLLSFLPADFRSDYGRDMEHAFEDLEREARAALETNVRGNSPAVWHN